MHKVLHEELMMRQAEGAADVYDSDGENLRMHQNSILNPRHAERSARVMSARTAEELYKALEPHGA